MTLMTTTSALKDRCVQVNRLVSLENDFRVINRNVVNKLYTFNGFYNFCIGSPTRKIIQLISLTKSITRKVNITQMYYILKSIVRYNSPVEHAFLSWSPHLRTITDAPTGIVLIFIIKNINCNYVVIFQKFDNLNFFSLL